MLAWKLASRRAAEPFQQYSMSLLSAITEDEMLASQFVEGGVDSSVYENFVYETLKAVRTREGMRHRTVVLIMDNAAIHHQEMVLATAARFRVFVLFLAPYSPWLQPVEHVF